MSELVFFCGTMDCGKSTLALQIEHNRSARGKRGLIFTRDDRAGSGVLSSRLGLFTKAVEAPDDFDFFEHVRGHLAAGRAADYVIADEAQFFTAAQIEQLAMVVDEIGLDVYAFGITTDFRTRLFPGAQRLVELADRIEVLQVEALCWCGARATHNARTLGGRMVVEGAQVVIGDVNGPGSEVGYEVLCRRHHLGRRTALTEATAGRPAANGPGGHTAHEPSATRPAAHEPSGPRTAGRESAGTCSAGRDRAEGDRAGAGRTPAPRG